MFHYRNHGAAFGKVLMGVQMPKSDRRAFQLCLDALGFNYKEENSNLAYRLFVGGSEQACPSV
jgi:threonine dehydratase